MSADGRSATGEVDRAPTSTSSYVAAIAALVALAAAGWYAWPALWLCAAGVATLLAGVVVGRRGAVTAGATTLFLGVLAAGLAEAPVLPLLVAAVATAVAYDAGGRAVTLGGQLGREAPTRRLEAGHAGATALVGVLAAGVGVGTYRAAGAGQPVTALVFLLLAAVLVASALR